MHQKKNGTDSRNYLTFVPSRAPLCGWHADEKTGLVTLEIENRGFFNRLAQKLFHKPRISQIHLDENGSFVWQMTDGKRDILAIGTLVDERFGEAAAPLYPRLAEFFRIMQSYHFILLRDPDGNEIR